MSPRTQLVALAGTSDARSLAAAALCIAAEAYPDLAVDVWLARLDALGWRAAERVTPDLGVDAAAGAVARLLFEDEGLQGNTEDYGDPRNSFLNDVLDRRLGIPITLSVVFMVVAARAGLDVRGIGLPGHFVVRAERGGQVRLLDPFHAGRRLDGAACAALVGRNQPGARLDPRWLEPMTTRQVLVRMLNNLKTTYRARSDWAGALGAAERIRLLAPEALGEIRDCGHLRARLGQAAGAIRDFETYLREAPDAPDAAEVRGLLRAVRQALAALN